MNCSYCKRNLTYECTTRTIRSNKVKKYRCIYCGVNYNRYKIGPQSSRSRSQ